MKELARRLVPALVLVSLMGGFAAGCSEKSDEEKAIEEIQKEVEETMNEQS